MSYSDYTVAGEKVAVEVDGPHHFTANGQRPLGEMRARHRLLDVRGWSVLSVPYFLWAKQADDTAHVLFLRQVCYTSILDQRVSLQRRTQALLVKLGVALLATG